MRKMTIPALAFTYAGCYLGAGFLSGQELWQFFGSFGTMGYFGFLVSALLFILLGVVLLRLIQKTGCDRLDELLVPWPRLAWLRRGASIVETAFLFFVVLLMAAGVGALGQQLFGIAEGLGSAVFVVFVGVTSILGVRGMVRVFSLLIPILILYTIFCAGGALQQYDTASIFSTVPCNDNPMMPNWFTAALIYVTFGMLSGVGIMVPVGKLITKKSTIWWGVILAVLGLVMVAGSILVSIAVYPEASGQQLPMVAVASSLHPLVGKCYGLLLLLGMFSNALASLVGLLTHMGQHFTVIEKHRAGAIILACVLAWAGSLLGFSDIIGVVFPVFGYIAVVYMTTLLVHFFQKTDVKTEA